MSHLPDLDRPTRVRFVVLGGLCAVAMIMYSQRLSLGVVEKEIREGLELSTRQSGLLNSGFFLTYALLQVPGAWIGQICGSRKALSAYSLVSSAGTALFVLTGGFAGMFASRLTMGAGQAGAFPCTTNTVKSWFPPTNFAVANGSITAFMQVGIIFGTVTTGILASTLGWRLTLGLFALPGLIWSIWFYAWFRDRPSEHPSVHLEEAQLVEQSRVDESGAEAGPPAIPWLLLLTSPTLAMICAQQFFRGAGYSFYGSWFTTFLRDGRNVSLEHGAMLTTLPLIGTAAGSFIGGWLSDSILLSTGSRRLARQGLAAVSQVACAVIIVAAFRVTDATLISAVIGTGSFCAALAGPVAYTVTIDMGGRHVPTVFALMNMWGNIGAFVFPVIVGWLLGRSGAPETSSQSPEAWKQVFFLFAGIYAAATVCWLLFNPEGTIFSRPGKTSPAENTD